MREEEEEEEEEEEQEEEEGEEERSHISGAAPLVQRSKSVWIRTHPMEMTLNYMTTVHLTTAN